MDAVGAKYGRTRGRSGLDFRMDGHVRWSKSTKHKACVFEGLAEVEATFAKVRQSTYVAIYAVSYCRQCMVPYIHI